MSNFFKYFKGSLGFGILSIIAAFVFLGGIKAAIIVAILAVLEVSLSFDNAVVNAKQLGGMDEIWRKRFLTWGMIIAVFGMRIIFPLLIVSVVAKISPLAAVTLAIGNPAEYAHVLTSAHVLVAGFGMAFLMMVFLKFFFDKEKDLHWVSIIEAPLTKLGKIEAAEIAVTLGFTYFISTFLPAAEMTGFILAAIAGLVTYIIVEGIGTFLDAGDAAVTVAKAGFAGFMYLEVLDASFSFDGVIGAFALTNNIFIIALGLGVGAFAVRGLTLMLVDTGTLSEYRYLEHGAFYAIGALAILMGVGVFHEVPEIVTGLLGAAFIGTALISSVIHNRHEDDIAFAAGQEQRMQELSAKLAASVRGMGIVNDTEVIGNISQVNKTGDNNLVINT